MRTILIILAAILLTANALFAQHARFVSSGSIEYEKTANTYALIKKMMGDDGNSSWQQTVFDSYKKSQPQFKILKSTLTFNNNKSLFTPETVETTISNNFFGELPMVEQKNIVYSDFNTGMRTCQKGFFDATLLLKDSLKTIKWKITDETRTIAGYICRRANGLTQDSTYVVAFYTDKIPVSSGPESFSGLPGMILEVALPHENITWKAVKITDVEIVPATIAPPKKGKVVNNKELYKTASDVFKNYSSPAELITRIRPYLL